MTCNTKFQPGKSGNPKGRPRGSRDKRTAFRQMFQDKAPEIISKVIEKALEGDSACLRMCMDRIVTPYKPASEPISMIAMEGTMSQRGELILEQMASGKLSPADAASVITSLGNQMKIIETCELALRIEKLENSNDSKK